MKPIQTKAFKKVPHFKNEDAERRFWSTHDSAEYLDWSQAAKNPSLSNLKPSTHTISLRLSDSLLGDIKRIAHKRDVPYQSLMKIFLTEEVRRQEAA